MHKSEWPKEYLDRHEVVVRNDTVYVKSINGGEMSLASNSGIKGYLSGDVVIVEYPNGTRLRYYGPYGSQRENY